MSLKRHHHFMLSFTGSLLRAARRPVFAYLFTLSFSLIALSSLGILLAERGANPKIGGFFDALYYSVTIMSGVGLGDLVPVTALGRILSMFMMLAGTGLFVCFTALLAVILLEIELEHRDK